MEGEVTITGKEIMLLIAIFTFLITAGTLIWRLAVLHTRCIAAEKSAERAHSRIDKLEDDQDNKILKVSDQVNIIEKIQARMDEKLNYLVKLERGKINDKG